MERKLYVQGRLFGEADRHEGKGYAHVYTRYQERIEKLQNIILELRKNDLGNGHCFMFFDDLLEEDQAFYEYPDGRITIERLDKSNIEVPRQIIHVLNASETKAFRNKHAIIR
nr:hypothetical protein [uncultured Pedobacter sp.]